MTKETIDNLKNKLIKLSQLLASYQSNKDKVFIYDDKRFDQIFVDYNNIKGKIKKIIANDKFLLDRHKIAAFFIIAIIKNKPIVLKMNKTDIKNDDLEFVANLNLAITFANYIIKTFYEFKNKKSLKIFTPKSDTTNYNDQLVGLIRALKDTIETENTKEILLMAISHILFLIEKYSECEMEKLGKH